MRGPSSYVKSTKSFSAIQHKPYHFCHFCNRLSRFSSDYWLTQTLDKIGLQANIKPGLAADKTFASEYLIHMIIIFSTNQTSSRWL